MDVCLRIKQRLQELGLEQKDLASAAKVTGSYISQLLTRKKLPPAPERTDIYEKIAKALKLPSNELLKLVDAQRKEALKKRWGDTPAPLFQRMRKMILQKCAPTQRNRIAGIFEKEPFGEIERFVIGKILDVAKGLVREELGNDKWVRQVARLGRRSYEQARVNILEFLDTDAYHLSPGDCRTFLEPLMKSWEIDLATFEMQVVLNRRLASKPFKRFEYVEIDSAPPLQEERGLKEFLANPLQSRDATAEELSFLKRLRFQSKRPTALYYYRELQSLRDPLHFRD